MIIDDNALMRLSSSFSGRSYRLFIGGKEEFINYALYEQNEPVSFPGETTTTDFIAFGNDPIDIEVVDGSGYSNSAGSFNLVSSRGTSWVRYTTRSGNTFQGCTLVFGVDSHYTGAIVNLWVDVTNRLTSVQGNESDSNNTLDWTWSISGDRYNSDLMPEDCSVILLETVTPEGNYAEWDSFKLRALGYVRHWQSEGTANQVRHWSATIESIRTYVEQKQVPGGVFGRVNLAEGQPVNASDHLANPLDLVGLDQPEWLGAVGTTDADKVTNASIDDGPYVSQIQPTATPETQAATQGIIIQEIFLGDETYPNLKWFQLLLPQASPAYNPTGVSLNQMFLTNKQTVFIPSRNNPFPVGHPCAGDRMPDEIKAGAQNYIALRDITLSENTDRIIFTNNKAQFLARWHVSSAIPVYDWTEMPGHGDDGRSAANFTLAANDWLQLRGYVNNGQFPQQVFDMVVWGTHVGDPWWNNPGDSCDNGSHWDGFDAVATPASGESIRRSPVALDTQDKNDWIIEENPNPADRRDETDAAYISIEIPLIPTVLSESITDVSPAADDLLPLLNPEYLRPTVGSNLLVIRIDSERMLLQQLAGGEWVIVARGYQSTPPANHDGDTEVFYNHPTYGFIRYSWVETVELRRWARYDRELITIGDSQIMRLSPRVPQIWEIWGSIEESPAYYGDGDWKPDWVGSTSIVTTETGKDEGLTNGVIPNPFVQSKRIPIQPLRHVMVVIKRMNIDSTYAMVNEIRIWRAGLSGAVTQFEGIGNVVYSYLRKLLPANRIIIDNNVFDGVGADITITGGSLGRILTDLATTYGFKIKYTRDGKVRIMRSQYHPLAERPDFLAILGGRSIEGTVNPQRATYPSKVGAGQYVVRIHDTSNLTVYQGVYPPRSSFGDVKTIDLTMNVGDTESATRIAATLYLEDGAISRELEFVTVGAFPEAEAGARLLVFDNSDDAAPFGRYVDCKINGVVHNDGGKERLLVQEWRQAAT